MLSWKIILPDPGIRGIESCFLLSENNKVITISPLLLIYIATCYNLSPRSCGEEVCWKINKLLKECKKYKKETICKRRKIITK
jgi:hypothetical protein